ncbi:MAG: Serine hydroxymethyltransferase [Parcubacteria group bacterium GW2011_GWB1_45_7]|uniref:Serine hydroxymethyltransferase n=2 Tax=Candidatus Colwelliibacteriota TaxID=1817904 RepID=A0A1G1ZD69_9BACT|nr:MAG: Serine hydroxymethyltransferase [Parcubacteria group bacterium GW2011_GWB1_45_7]OGY58795.1 MAG: serine hydroxymethyltransferase [Candidatus Colwellbacteria bacterium RIFCSPHIGHO2_02_FULL_45_17]OGY61134.1 MAG: serine hydroxymethyltransferase [Candidatus Colwellbacteria bacterium RIFCSPLOWO2_02_FULL_45_11]OGY62066.1 MAG: serine hydroxymethyltransferase [Candidatus Colwellbacteria bacterium RIFCSPLOWO2_12_FULL_46_17]
MKDKEIQKLINLEIKRQKETLDLIASENLASRDVLAPLGSPLSNKYSEGYPGKRYYPGNEYHDKIEILAQKRALKLFKLDPKKWSVNVQPYSGSPANLAVYVGLAEPGDTIMGMKLAAGGHLTHGHKVSASGIFYNSVQYGVNPKTGKVDYDEVLRLAKKAKPKVFVSGFTAYPRRFNFKKFGEIAKKVGAYHLSDISHIAGLVAGGAHPSPFPYADVVMTTTHKSLRGPRGAVLFSRNEIKEKIDKAVFPGLQGGPHNNVTASKAVAFKEAMRPEFKIYARQIVKNAEALAGELKKLGFNLVTGGTDTHLILVDMRAFNMDGLTAERRLEKSNIVANRNSVPGDPSPFKPSGVRLGTPSLTTRGMKEKEMRLIAHLIYDAVHNKKGTKAKVIALCKKFPAKSYLS